MSQTNLVSRIIPLVTIHIIQCCAAAAALAIYVPTQVPAPEMAWNFGIDFYVVLVI